MGYDEWTLKEWRDAVAPYARAMPTLDPRSSALLVVDMQRFFAPLCAPIVDAVTRAVSACRERGVSVLFTQHGHADPESDGGMLHEWWGDSILEETEDHALLPDLGVGGDDLVIRKRRYSAFHDTGLNEILRERGVSDLAIAGVMTNLCVETTARDAFVRDFRVRVLMDATATATEEMQRASLINLAYGFAHVQTVDEWLRNAAGQP
jgi:nicotinamidase-related amidase